MKFIFQIYLKFLAKIILKKFKPRIIAVCGSTNKSTAVAAIARALSPQIEIAASPKNYNAEIGIPLSVLRIQPEGATKIERWSSIAWRALRQVLSLKTYPKIILLEFGMHTPKDAETVLSIATPDICIFTNLAPSILSHTDKSDQYNKTFSYFLRRLPKDTILITNSDDPHLEELAQFFPDKVLRYGQSASSGWKLSEISDTDAGQEFIGCGGEIFPIKIKEFGLHHAYIAAAAFALSSELKLDLKKIQREFCNK